MKKNIETIKVYDSIKDAVKDTTKKLEDFHIRTTGQKK